LQLNTPGSRLRKLTIIIGLLVTDSLFGGFDDDLLVGDPGNDYLFGVVGNDILIGGLGANYFDCGDGIDEVVDFDPAIEAGYCLKFVTRDLENI
jgi:Ca2+-binding RTX toxin-like protein